MKHDVRLEFDLTNPEELNIYNMIRNLEGIKNAIVTFKDYIQSVKKDSEDIKITTPDAIKSALLSKISDIVINFDRLFKENGVTV